MSDPLAGQLWRCDQGDAIDWLNSLPADCATMTFGSPPYCDARTYGIDAQRGCLEWVEWMLQVTEAAARVTLGPVFWVVGGVTRDRCYWPACEGLAWEWWRRGGIHQLYRPCCWHRVGIPGSGGDDYWRADWEYVLCFKRPGKLPWSDNTATGHPPKWAPGGEMSHRMSNGARVNEWGGSGKSTSRHADGSLVRQTGADLFDESATEANVPVWTNRHGMPNADQTGAARRIVRRKSHTKKMYARHGDDRPEDEAYVPPVLANPGNVLSIPVGGGRMGNDLAHENEAPFPEALVMPFVRSFAAEGSIVCDPFSGSGTTAAVALRWGRRALCCDLRESQVLLTRRRVAGEIGLFHQRPE